MTKDNATVARVTDSGERTPVADHKNIGEAFLAIMSEVGYVQKTGYNKAQSYKYAGERQLIEALRPALLKHKVICIPSEAKSRTEVVVTSPLLVDDKLVDKEKKTYRTVIDYTFIYTHVPSSTHIQVQVVGEGVDNGDKAAYKAATGALKYALRQPFLIETGDEPEAHDLPDEKEAKPEKNSPTSGPRTAQQEFGSGVKFKEHWQKVFDAIGRAVDPEHFTWINQQIERIRLVDDASADQLEDMVENRMGILAV